MVLPSVFLMIACFGFVVAGVTALVLQFSDRPPAATVPTLYLGIIIGAAMLAASLISMPSVQDVHDEPLIVRLLTSRGIAAH